MPVIAKTLSPVEVNRLKLTGWHAVGGVAGLLLQIRESTRAESSILRSWILRVRIGRERQLIGLGPYPQVTLAEARERAKKLVSDGRQGVNLKAQKKGVRSALIAASAKNKTFKECAEAYMEAHSQDYTNAKHRKQWASTLETYSYPIIGKILVADISMRHVLDVLLQDTKALDKSTGKLWHTKTETAKRLLGRIKTVLDYATVNEYRSGSNPALWSGYLDTQLPSPKKLTGTKHHSAIPYFEMGDFMVKIRNNNSISAKALQFLILTAVRSGSVRKAEWSEINLSKKMWIIPLEHTKTRQEHRIPLQSQAITLLKSLPRIAGNNKIFPSPRGVALSDMALSQLMRGMKERGELTTDAVPHGFRSTFRDWAAEQTAYPDDIRKAASGHTVGNAVQQAYQRTDLLEKRRRMMEDWSRYLNQTQKKHENIRPIRRPVNG